MRQLLVTILATVLASATATTANAATTTATDVKITIQIRNDDTADPTDPGTTWRDMTDIEKKTFWNTAHCECGEPIRLKLEKTATTISGTPIQVWAGARCDDNADLQRAQRCTELDAGFQFSPTSAFHYMIVPANELEWPPSGMCQNNVATQHIFVLVDQGGDGTYESTSISEDIAVDTQNAPDVGNITATGGEDAIVLKWELPTTRLDDIRSFQVLCAVNGQPMLASPASSPDYDVCPGASPPIVPPVDAGPGLDAGPKADAGPPDASPIDAAPVVDARTFDARIGPDAGTMGTIEELDPAFICSGVIPAGSKDARITVPSAVAAALGPTDTIELVLVETDSHKNPNPLFAGNARPQPVRDFWETYTDAGGSAQGGFCFVATAAYGSYDHPFVVVLRDFRDDTLAKTSVGRAFIRWYYRNSPPLAAYIRTHPVARFLAQVVLWPVVFLAGTWEYTTAWDKLVLLVLFALLVSRRLRRRLRAHKRVLAATATGLVLLVAGARTASAQEGGAYYDESFDDQALDEMQHKDPAWTFELKFGPYIPAIDSEPGLTKIANASGKMVGPYELMYGNSHALMMQMELDRYFLYPSGQLGVMLGWGYMSNGAQSFVENPDGTVDYTMRSKADSTGFRLFPLSLGGVYRFTSLANKTKIPIVPYVKGGLDYYIWYVIKGNGNLASTMKNGSAYGGTLGVQGTIGIDIRADELDPTAAQSLQSELGVRHAGFFVEGTYAWVNGLFQSNRLRVGDLTWFAGVNFEF